MGGEEMRARVFVTRPTACPYLSDRQAVLQGIEAERFPGDVYRALLDLNFRRSGNQVYRPACQGCTECRQIRIPVARFRASRSQRRVLRRNLDIEAVVARPKPDAERFELYCRYLDSRHDDAMSRSQDAFVDFLYGDRIESVEVTYRSGHRLLAVSLVDVVPGAWSSVYSFFEPDEGRRSLGTYSALFEIGECVRRGLEHYYLGYHVAGAATMAYKARFLPHERLSSRMVFESFDRAYHRGVPAELLLASQNKGKLDEMRVLVDGLPFKVVAPADRGLLTAPDETGSSFAENARLKAREYAAQSGLLTVADDSGISVDALDGKPGLHSSRFGGEGANDLERNRLLLSLLEGVAEGRRGASFTCAVAVARGGEILFEAQESVHGLIAPEMRGARGFGYDPLFFYPPFGKTFGEVPREEKDRVSHRGKAFARLRTFLATLTG